MVHGQFLFSRPAKIIFRKMENGPQQLQAKCGGKRTRRVYDRGGLLEKQKVMKESFNNISWLWALREAISRGSGVSSGAYRLGSRASEAFQASTLPSSKVTRPLWPSRSRLARILPPPRASSMILRGGEGPGQAIGAEGVPRRWRGWERRRRSPCLLLEGRLQPS